MFRSKFFSVMTILLFSVLLLASGCSEPSKSDDSSEPNAQRISALETSIADWKRLQDSGEWDKLVASGDAIDAIDDDSFIKKPAGFANHKIQQLEKELAELKSDN